MSDTYNYPYIGYYTAVGLENYGFNRPQFTYYKRGKFNEKQIISSSIKRLYKFTESYVTAPTYDEVVAWLREEYQIFVQVFPSYNSPDESLDDKKVIGYYYKVFNSARSNIEKEIAMLNEEIKYYSTYAEAIDIAINKGVELIRQ